MPTMYTDESREATASKNRLLKERLDLAYKIMSIASLVVGIGLALWLFYLVLTKTIAPFLSSAPIIESPDARAVILLAMYVPVAISNNYSFKIRTVFAAWAAIIITVLLTILMKWSGYFLAWLPFGFIALFLAYNWKNLSAEEGFPLFNISITEMEERMQNAEKITRFQATKQGARTCRPLPDASQILNNPTYASPSPEHISNGMPACDEMPDIFAGEEAPIEKQNLTGYHERYGEQTRQNVGMSDPSVRYLDENQKQEHTN